MATIDLTPQNLNQFAMGKIFTQDRLTSLNFDSSGEFLATTSEDTIRIFSATEGKECKHSYSKKYGCNLVRFTHKNTSVLHSSTKVNHTIRYLSTHDNKYIRYFEAHTANVLNMEVSPVDDTFLSSGMDDTVRIWDLRYSEPTSLLNVPKNLAPNEVRPLIAYDPSGLVFAVACNSRFLRLYDARNIQAGPFLTTNIPSHSPSTWNSLKFSNDSKCIVISTNSNYTILVDGNSGEFRCNLVGYVNSAMKPIEASFTPDSKFVFCGSQNGVINFWSTVTGNLVSSLTGNGDATDIVEFNPRYAMFASIVDSSLGFWIPQTVV